LSICGQEFRVSSADTIGFAVPERRTPARTPHSLPAWLSIVMVSGLSLVLSAAGIAHVWRTNAFFDSDDAMQLVEVRALLNGQTWFDLTAYRLDPPHGVFMHWSRLIDAPLALFIRLFELFMPVAAAERLTRVVFPLLLLSLLYVGVAQLARRLIGAQGVLPALLLALFSGAVFGQFQPGHITHSASQVVLLVFMLGGFVASLTPGLAYRAAVAGLLASVSLAISLETLPFIATLAASAVVLWVAAAQELRKSLLAFGLGLGLSLPLLFVASVGPARWSNLACDAFSPAYLVPGLAGAGALVGLGLASPRLRNWRWRLTAAGGAGAGVLVVTALIRPGCFLDPYTGIDPLLREVWLKHVEEALPLVRFALLRPTAALALWMPLAIGLAATLMAIKYDRERARLRWVVVAAVTGVGFLLVFWQIRLIAFVSPLALLGSSWAIVQFQNYVKSTRWQAASALVLLAIAPFSSFGWALALPGGDASPDSRNACLATSAFASLAHLPPGLVAGPIDAGSHILALTPQSVLAAPYHRDNRGNRIVLDALLATPDRAQGILKAAHVAYVVNCTGFSEYKALAARAPTSLAARIVQGSPPAWLTPLPQNGPYQVFVMRP
jgi:hypothetical protein